MVEVRDVTDLSEHDRRAYHEAQDQMLVEGATELMLNVLMSRRCEAAGDLADCALSFLMEMLQGSN